MPKTLKSIILPLLIFSLASVNDLSAQGPENILWAVDVGPEYTAIGGNFDSLFLWSNQKSNADIKLALGGTITNVKWHPTEDWLAISTQFYKVDGGVNILDTKTMTFQKLEGFPSGGARAIGWSPSGKMLAVGDNEGDLHLFDRSFSLIKKVDTGLRSITGLSWHPTKPIITMASGKIGSYELTEDRMQVWESRKEEILLLSVDWHPSGAFFALGDYGDNYAPYPAHLQFHQPNGSLIKTVLGSKAEYRNIQWTADGLRLATVSDAFRLWTKAGELVSTLPFDHLLWGLSYDRQKQQWVITDDAGQVHWVSVDGKTLLGTITPFKLN